STSSGFSLTTAVGPRESRGPRPFMATAAEIEKALTEAIQNRVIVRLGYARQRDEIVSLHRVAPVDIRAGETRNTGGRAYLWAYCYEEALVETHLMGRIRSVTLTAEHFRPTAIFAQWPKAWPIPER